MPHLKAYDKEGNILAIGYNVTGDQGSVIIPNLKPHTNYPQGEFYVSWEGDNYESEKTVVPEFTTLESSYKEIIFYAKDILTIKPKTAYDIAVDNGFTGTEEEWVESIKGEQGEPGEKGEPGKDGVSPTLPDMGNWQKVSLTDSAGNVLFLYEIDFNTIDTLDLTTGFYYVSKGINLPKNVVNYGYLVYKKLNNNMQRIEYSPFNSSETYIKNKVDTWGEWEIAVMSNEDVKKMKDTIETQSQQIAMLQELIMNREV